MPNLNIKTFAQDLNAGGVQYSFAFYQAIDYYGQPLSPPIPVQIGTPQSPSTLPYPIFPDGNSACMYYKDDPVLGCPALMATVNSAIGSSYYTTYTVEYTDTPVSAALAMLAPVALSDQYSDLLGKPTFATVATSGSYNDLSNKPSLTKSYSYNSGSSPSLRSAPVELTASAIVSSGTIVIYLTDTGTSTGNALFTNIDYMKAEVSNATTSFNYAYAITNSNKTLTITVDQINVALGLLSFASAANGVNVNVFIKGN